MQAMDQRTQKTSITVSTHIKERVCSRRRGNQTYDDVLNVLLDTVDTGEKGDEQGVVFLHTVYVKGELKKLKQPILLKMMIQEDNSYVLANEEFSFLISCSSIADGLEEGRRMLEEDYALYTNPENQVHPWQKNVLKCCSLRSGGNANGGAESEKKVSAALEKKGFERLSGKVHHCRYEFYLNGKPSGVKTYLSHNKQEITGDLLAWMAKETYLSQEEFADMISCNIGHDELAARYAALGLLRKE